MTGGGVTVGEGTGAAGPAAGTCTACGLRLESEDVYCSGCGLPAGRVEWSASTDRRPGAGPAVVPEGGTFYVVAANAGAAPVTVEVDPLRAPALEFEPPLARRVSPHQVQSFLVRHLSGEPSGVCRLLSEDGPRKHWWERRSTRELEAQVTDLVRVLAEEWVVGCECVHFPPDVTRQFVRVWNDSEAARRFSSATPPGMKLIALDVPPGPDPLLVPPGGSLSLALDLIAPQPEAIPDWPAGPDARPVRLTRAAAAPPEAGPDAVVAIDFGTRNTGVRIRWRRTLAPARPAGSVDAIGDRGGADRFPTAMLIDTRERSLRWGTEAAERIAASRLTPDEAPILNLKSAIREGVDRFTTHHPSWTNAELVGRYFERIVHRVDEYLRALDPDHPLSRQALTLRWVVCRPVLDANEGDHLGRRYEETLRQALVRCGIDAESISFLHEPVAALTGVVRCRPDFVSVTPGSAVAVVDSGGGTTDVALARVNIDERGLTLDILGSYALEMADDNPAGAALAFFSQRDRQLGGNVLDWVLAYTLIHRAPALLETDGRPVPPTLWEAPPSKELAAARTREFILTCRRLKERFVRSSTQYLNRPAGAQGEAGEVLPFPHRPDLEGVYLVHALFDEHILAPILTPVAEELARDLHERSGSGDAGLPRPTQIQQVCFVGGTNIDPFVRRRLGRPFPMARGEDGREAQSPERVRERLNAVVEGAVWNGEPLFPTSRASLALLLDGESTPLVRAGDPLPPRRGSEPRFFPRRLEPGAELSAALVLEGDGHPSVVARTFYRNTQAGFREVILRVSVNAEDGCLGEIQLETGRVPQWRFACAPTGEAG